MRTEYWVMRVVLHNRKPRTPAAHIAVMALVNAGTFCLLPSQDIVEPVEVFDEERQAQEHREQLLREFPHEDFRIVMNTDADVHV
jgi:hypothetical protein